jgi:hypothetical protein
VLMTGASAILGDRFWWSCKANVQERALLKCAAANQDGPGDDGPAGGNLPQDGIRSGATEIAAYDIAVLQDQDSGTLDLAVIEQEPIQDAIVVDEFAKPDHRSSVTLVASHGGSLPPGRSTPQSPPPIGQEHPEHEQGDEQRTLGVDAEHIESLFPEAPFKNLDDPANAIARVPQSAEDFAAVRESYVRGHCVIEFYLVATGGADNRYVCQLCAQFQRLPQVGTWPYLRDPPLPLDSRSNLFDEWSREYRIDNAVFISEVQKFKPSQVPVLGEAVPSLVRLKSSNEPAMWFGQLAKSALGPSLAQLLIVPTDRKLHPSIDWPASQIMLRQGVDDVIETGSQIVDDVPDIGSPSQSSQGQVREALNPHYVVSRLGIQVYPRAYGCFVRMKPGIELGLERFKMLVRPGQFHSPARVNKRIEHGD